MTKHREIKYQICPKLHIIHSFFPSKIIDIITKTANINGYIRYGMQLKLEILAILEATRSCAPYGIIPCMIHELVSRRDATFLGSTPYSFPMCLAIGAATTIATVLLAVATSINAVSIDIPNIAPILELAFFLILLYIDYILYSLLLSF